MSYAKFYKNECNSLDFKTFSNVKSKVYEYFKDDKCPPEIKIKFGDWLFRKLYMYYKPTTHEIIQKCGDIIPAIDKHKNIVVKGDYLHYHNIDALNIIAEHFYMERFGNEDDYFILQMLNDVQLVKNYVCNLHINPEKVKKHFIEWINKSQVFEQKSNLLDVLLRYYSGDKEVHKIYQDMRFSGKSQSVYSDEQNVHDKEIQQSSLTVAQKFIEDWSWKDLPEGVLLYDFLQGILTEVYKSRNLKIVVCVMERLRIDTTSFGDGFMAGDVFAALVYYILKSSNKDVLFDILYDEMDAMKELCTSGYVERLINVLQGFDEKYKVTMSFDKQLHAVITHKLFEAMDHAEEKVINGMTDEEDKEVYLLFVAKIVTKEMSRLVKDYGEKDVMFVLPQTLEKITGHSNWDVSLGKITPTGTSNKLDELTL